MKKLNEATYDDEQEIDELDVVDDVEEEGEKKQREEALVKVAMLGQALVKTRDDAVSARQSSGIEQDWDDDDEAYEGIDDANRDMVSMGKPTSPNGGSIGSPVKDIRSRVFLNITRPYTDAAAAKIADMLLPTDEENFSIRPTPIPELEAYKGDKTQIISPQTLNPMVKTVENQDGTQETSAFTVDDKIEETKRKADEAVKKAKTRILDWHVESGYNDEFRKTVESAARLGTGILKGPFPTTSKSKIVIKEGGLTKISIQNKISPASKCVDVRNFFPDPSCGNDIHKGNFVWERDIITGRVLRDLLDTEDSDYIPENIMAVLAEGPATKKVTNTINKNYSTELADKSQFEIWYYYGFVDSEQLEAAGCECEEGENIPAVVVMVNDHVIKAALSPMESGDFIFDVFVWQARPDHWTGIGVAKQIRTPQRMINAATRGMMDNHGLSSGPQIVFRNGLVTPADGINQITPRKLWYAGEDAENMSISDVFSTFDIPSKQVESMNIIQFALKMAEDVTGLPMILQGQQGKAPDTVGGMTMLANNASTVLRRLARNADSMLIKPHIRRYYEWLLEDPDVPDEEKGDFKIDARGSSALVERDLHNQMLGQALQLSLNPAFELSPSRTLKEFLSSQRVDTRSLELTDAEKQQIQQAQANQPQDPRTITAQANIEATQIRTQAEVQKAQAQADANKMVVESRMLDNAEDRKYRMAEMQLKKELAMLEMASKENITLEQIKAQLADTTIKERNKRDMFNAEVEVKDETGSGI